MLGLALVAEEAFALVFDAHGIMLRVQNVHAAGVVARRAVYCLWRRWRPLRDERGRVGGHANTHGWDQRSGVSELDTVTRKRPGARQHV